MWGGATFDTAMRFLHEDPWDRLRLLREKIPNICFQMLFRGANAVGYSNYPGQRRRRLRQTRRRHRHRYFPHFRFAQLHARTCKAAMEAVQETHAVCEAAICYTGDILDPETRPSIRSNITSSWRKELEKMGAHFLAIKDMAGLCRPFAAYALVKALKEEIGLPVHFHTHDTSGVNSASVLKASEAGVDIVDLAIASMSGSTSQPNLNSIVAALHHTPRDTGLDLAALNEFSDYWEQVRACLRALRHRPAQRHAPKSMTTKCPAASTPTSRNRPPAWAWASAGRKSPAPTPRSTSSSATSSKSPPAAKSSATWPCS